MSEVHKAVKEIDKHLSALTKTYLEARYALLGLKDAVQKAKSLSKQAVFDEETKQIALEITDADLLK